MASKPLRVSNELYLQAESAGDTHKRSVSKQVEFWAELGKIAEQTLTVQEVNDLLHGKAKVETRPLKSPSVDFDEVFNELEEDRKAGLLTSQVLTSKEWYRLSKERPGYLEKVSTSGDVQVGKIKNGEFVVSKDLDERVSG